MAVVIPVTGSFLQHVTTGTASTLSMSWQLIFAVVLPVAGVLTVLGVRELVNIAEPRPSRIDWAGVGVDHGRAEP